MQRTRSFLLLAFVTIGILQCGSPKTVAFENLQKGHWSSIEIVDKSEPVERHEAAFVGVGDKFYLLGGRGMKPTSIYDTKNNSWSQGAVPPIEMHHFQPVVYHDEVYIIGAMTGPYPGETPLPHIYIYNPQKDQWRQGDEIPEDRQRGGAGSILYKDKIYLVCGIKDGHRGDHKKWLDEYDLKSGIWTVLPDAPRARDHFQAEIANDQLYALGGRTTIASDNPFKNTIGEVDVFNFESLEWKTLKRPLPTPRAGNAAITIGDEIIVIGGESFSQTPAHSEMESLNIKNQQWRSLPLLSQGRHGTGAIWHKGKIYLASGSGNRGGGPELKDLICFGFKNK